MQSCAHLVRHKTYWSLQGLLPTENAYILADRHGWLVLSSNFHFQSLTRIRTTPLVRWGERPPLATFAGKGIAQRVGGDQAILKVVAVHSGDKGLHPSPRPFRASGSTVRATSHGKLWAATGSAQAKPRDGWASGTRALGIGCRFPAGHTLFF